MVGILYRWTLKISITLLLIISLISLATPSAAALNKPEDKNKEGLQGDRASTATEPAPKAPVISYTLYQGATEPRAELSIPADQPQIEGTLNHAANVKPSISVIIKTGAVKRLSTIPLPTNA